MNQIWLTRIQGLVLSFVHIDLSYDKKLIGGMTSTCAMYLHLHAILYAATKVKLKNVFVSYLHDDNIYHHFCNSESITQMRNKNQFRQHFYWQHKYVVCKCQGAGPYGGLRRTLGTSPTCIYLKILLNLTPFPLFTQWMENLAFSSRFTALKI